MPTLTVIKHFYLIKNIAARFFPHPVGLFIYPFTLHLKHTGELYMLEEILCALP